MIPYRAIAIGIAAVALFGAGWQVRTWYDGSLQTARLEAEQKASEQIAELANQVATRTETAIQGIKIENRSIYNKAVKEIVHEPVYRDCLLPADGVRRINQARGAAAIGEPDNPVPGTAVAR